MKFSKQFLDKLLSSAVYFHNTTQDGKDLPLSFNNLQDSVEIFRNVIKFEANKALQNEIIIESPILHATNLNTKNPGIISDEKDKKLIVHKEIKEKTEEQIAKELERKLLQQEKREKDKEIRQKEKQEGKDLKNEKKELKVMEKQILKTNKNLEKSKKKKDRIEKKKNKTEDDEQVYNYLKNEVEDLNNKCEEMVIEYDSKSKDYDSRNEDYNIRQEKKMMEKEEKKKKRDENKVKNEIKKEKRKEERERKIAEEERLYMEKLYDLTNEQCEDEIEEETSFSEIDSDKIRIYESPLPFQRHLESLDYVDINDGLVGTILNGEEPKMGCSLTIYHGPPGTGKTYKLIDTLSKLVKKYKDRKFLVCAASNIGTLNLYNRAKTFKIYGNLILSKEKKMDDVKNNNVYFSTISMRYSSLMRELNFDTVLIDEAAQCQESWMWGLLREDVKHIYLAGDPHQLPAVVSEEGNKYNHSRSLMTRLMELEYPSLLLNVQRRMHPDIVKFSNKYFYDNKLETEYGGNDLKMDAFKVINVDGKEERVGTSYQNRLEAEKIIDIVNDMKIDNTVIISPYQAQINLLKSLDSSLEVHTVDSFQGREADAIILTTVRNGEKVGFWNDYRRLNVGMTRAKHILRIVGNIETWNKQDGPLKLLFSECSSKNSDAYNS